MARLHTQENGNFGPFRLTWGLLLLVLLASTFVVLGRPLLELPVPIGRNHNEGWNAHHAVRALNDGPLYPPSDALITNNYPPLSFYVMGALGKLTGDPLRTGRALSLLSLLVVAFLVGRITAEATRQVVWGVFSGLLVLVTLGAHFQNYVAMNDPQMLGHALQYAGLCLFLQRGERRAGLLGTVALLCLGGLVKHSLVAVPLALAIWLALYRRSELRTFLAWSGGGVLLSLAVMRLLYGADGQEGILQYARTWSFHRVALALQRWVLPLVPLLAVSALAVVLRPRHRIVQIFGLIAASSLLTGLAVSAGSGINYNVIFDLVFSSCALGPLILARIGERAWAGATTSGTRLRWLQAVGLAALMASPVMVSPLRLHEFVQAYQGREARQQMAAAEFAFIERHSGPLLCQDPALSYWTGRPFEVDLLNYAQRLHTGDLDGDRLLELLQTAHFALVQLDRQDADSVLGQAAARALRRYYRLEHRSSLHGYFFVPHSAPADSVEGM